MTAQRELLPTASSREMRAALWRLVRPRRLLGLAAVVTLVTGVVITLAGPLLLGKIVDQVIDESSDRDITITAIGLLLVAIGQGVFTVAGNILVAKLGEGMLADLRERVVDRALNLPLAQIEAAGSGDLAARIGGDVAIVAHAVREVLPACTVAALNIGLTVVGLAVLDWRFALAGLCAAPVQVVSLVLFLRSSAPIYTAQRTAESERAQTVLDTVEGAAATRSFNLGAKQLAKVESRSGETLRLNIRTVAVQTVFSARLNFAELVGMAALLIAGFYLVRGGETTIGAATAAALFFHRLFDPIGVVLAFFDEALAASSGLRRLVGVSDLPLTPHTTHGDAGEDHLPVSLRDVRFAYVPGHDVLTDLSLDVAAGERVAVVGSSGAGKTTIAKLIVGIHEPSSGEVRIGGVSLAELDQDAVGRQIVLLTQEVHVFAGTIAQDLRLAWAGADDGALWAALERTGAANWVRGLPEGLETVVGAGGYRLTVAQAQQLALTRLLLADPPIALLDEATAEAGSAGARLLEASANAALEGRTSIVVAHRLTQAASADRVIVLERGRIVEQGTHEELVAAEGVYAAQWAAWTSHRAAPTPVVTFIANVEPGRSDSLADPAT